MIALIVIAWGLAAFNFGMWIAFPDAFNAAMFAVAFFCAAIVTIRNAGGAL